MTKSDARALREVSTAVAALAPKTERNTAAIPARRIAAGRDDQKMPLMARAILFIGGGKAQGLRATAVRRSFPIMGYVGPNGGGKSLAMVKDTLPSLARGRTVLSTVRLLDPATGRPARSYVPFTSFDQLLDLSHADVLMDEIVGIANSRSAQSLPVVVQNTLVQLRRRDITLRWTAPNWARSDKIIREVTQAVTECRGSFPGRSRRDESGDLRLWAPKRLFRFRTFDTAEFEEWSAGKRDKLQPVVSEWLKGPGSDAFAGYDTLDSVSMVAHGQDDGTCSVCGKKRRTEYCKDDHTHEDLSAAAARETLEKLEARGEFAGRTRLELLEHLEHAGDESLAEASAVAPDVA